LISLLALLARGGFPRQSYHSPGSISFSLHNASSSSTRARAVLYCTLSTTIGTPLFDRTDLRALAAAVAVVALLALLLASESEEVDVLVVAVLCVVVLFLSPFALCFDLDFDTLPALEFVLLAARVVLPALLLPLLPFALLVFFDWGWVAEEGAPAAAESAVAEAADLLGLGELVPPTGFNAKGVVFGRAALDGVEDS
jgi:hypothetical protein